MSNVAVLGVGSMGARMARRIVQAGHRLVVYNRTGEKARALVGEGVAVAPSPRAAVQDAEIVISMVTDDDASREVWLKGESGAIHGIGKGMVAVESSTVTREWALTLAREVEAREASFIDAPVVGSTPQADAGALIFLLGGSAEAYERVRQVLSAAAASIQLVGGIGDGATMKLVVNSLFASQVSALSETIVMAERCGLPRERVSSILNELPVMSPALRNVAAQMTMRSFAPMFPIALVEKDMRYAVNTAAGVNVSVPMLDSTRQRFRDACDAGLGGLNISGVVELFK